MKNLLFKLLIPVLAIGLIVACQKDSLTSDLTAERQASVDKRATGNNYTTTLSGDNEVPPNESNAHGVLILKINEEDSTITYKLIASNIDSVTGAHLHLAPEGENGPVVVGLYGGPVTGAQNGILSQGTITAEDIVGSLEGDFDALISAIRADSVYTNVHTVAIPAGEIRGQLD